MIEPYIIQQMRVGPLDVFSYLIGCRKTSKALCIDPGAEVDRIAHEAEKNGFTIHYIVNTHSHSDHTGGNKKLKRYTGAVIAMHPRDARECSGVDLLLSEETSLTVGALEFKILHTPGHTPGGICLLLHGQLFTGDTLFVGDSGRTDLPGGNRVQLGASLRKIMKLPGETVVWPGHDYGPTVYSTLDWECKNNVNAREYGFWCG